MSEWLLDNDANINALDRFKRTPLEVSGPYLLAAHQEQS